MITRRIGALMNPNETIFEQPFSAAVDEILRHVLKPYESTAHCTTRASKSGLGPRRGTALPLSRTRPRSNHVVCTASSDRWFIKRLE